MVICRAQDSAAVREEAYKAALEDARQKASKLAEISGVKIGKVRSPFRNWITAIIPRNRQSPRIRILICRQIC